MSGIGNKVKVWRLLITDDLLVYVCHAGEALNSAKNMWKNLA
jgi:hypothetical protein